MALGRSEISGGGLQHEDLSVPANDYSNWCPYQSCKSCCAKAQNPCHIHVLKANATFPDKAPSSSSPLFNQQSTEVSSTSSGLGFRASLRASSIRQLSNNLQFNGAQVQLRSRRPLTRKDAAAINQWRFSKLKEYKERNIEAENEAFDRYMQNVGLLEEVFSLGSAGEEATADMLLALEPTFSFGEEDTQRMISGLKTRLNSNQGRKNAFRQKIGELVDGGLKKLLMSECSYEGGQASADDVDDQKEHKRPKRTIDWQAERASEVNDLIDKLNKARNEDDLNSCLVMKSKLFNQPEKADPTQRKEVEISKDENDVDIPAPKQVLDNSLPRSYKEAEINQEALCSIDMQFSSLDQIVGL
ncbi:uncharacterized protein LOC122069776 isoform X2 [Macadamia integrifolia]|uniref:uncharacterized protein LOC122069776 isoform X2 n=1 Tax=Macadamia integrifolia TaxID=60698 RepID=UPI001C4FDF71|nr:uncharacterized protein LOC122069776 isoform X2 [Macadamia integrifolia]